jgi:nucleoside-diphosphate-sugar epimerase
MSKKVLVLGGTRFIGRTFCESLLELGGIELTLFNRGQSDPNLFPEANKIVCDRNDSVGCKSKLAMTTWDTIIDFNGNSDQQIRNIVMNCEARHYTYISSSAVELSTSSDRQFGVAKNKLWCENLLAQYVKNLLIVRLGNVCGNHDYTERFEERNGVWYWSGRQVAVRPMVRVDFLARSLVQLMHSQTKGIVRAGYHAKDASTNAKQGFFI